MDITFYDILSMGMIGLTVLVLSLIVFFLPATLACKRKHPQKGFVTAANFCIVAASIWYPVCMMLWFLLLPYVFWKRGGL